MQNIELFGKIQSVVSKAISVIKEKIPEENINALFDFSAKTDFSAGNLEELNREFLEYQALIKEKIENKQTSNLFEENGEDLGDNPFEKINNI